jgi:hypothetical protein
VCARVCTGVHACVRTNEKARKLVNGIRLYLSPKKSQEDPNQSWPSSQFNHSGSMDAVARLRFTCFITLSPIGRSYKPMQGPEPYQTAYLLQGTWSEQLAVLEAVSCIIWEASVPISLM